MNLSPVQQRGLELLKRMKKLAAVHFFVGATAGGAVFLSNSYCLDKLKFFHEFLDSGFPSPLSSDTKDCFLEVLNDLQLKDEEKNLIIPFKTTRLGLWHAGYKRCKTLIGIPWYFDFKDPYDAIHPAKCWGKDVEWLSPEGEQHRETLILQKNEKKFAIAREIFEARSLLNSVIPVIPLTLSFISFAFLHRLRMRYPTVIDHSKWQRRGIYFLVYFSACFVFVGLKDAINLSIEYEADVDVSKIGLEEDQPTDLTMDYLKGGIEYYNKVLTRNKIIKDLYLPKYLKWMVSDKGDLTQYIRRKHASILVRKKELEGMLNNFEKYGQLHLENVDPEKRKEFMQKEHVLTAAKKKIQML